MIYGRDAQLLDTRQWVLERSGYRVCTVLNLADAEQVTRAENPSVFILCHSLSPTDCTAAVEMARVAVPGMKILTLTAGRPACNEPSLSTFDGPHRLIQAVGKLCAETESV